jgi:integrase
LRDGNVPRAGLRVSEAAQIRLDDLRPEQKAILINGKGGPYGKSAKYRLVPLNPNTEGSRRLSHRTHEDTQPDENRNPSALFRTIHRPKRQESIDVLSVHRMLLQITKQRGLPPMHPHRLRHACATCSTMDALSM